MFPSIPVFNVILKLPAFCIGDDSFTSIVLVNPSSLHVPDAPVTDMVVLLPVTVKSDPLAAIVLHCMGFLKTRVKMSGAQPTGVMLSIGVGISGNTVTGKNCPKGITRLQLSNKLIPFESFLMVIL